MEEEANAATRYWCHRCSQTVSAMVMEDEIKCTLCRSGFVEEMYEEDHRGNDRRATIASIWSPILMEMINDSSSPTTRNQSAEAENENNGRDLDSQLQEMLRIRGRPSVSVVQLLHGLGPESSNRDDDNNNNNNNNNGERGRVIFVNPHHQIIAIPSSLVRDSMPVAGSSSSSLSDYFVGPGFEALLQRLAENDPNRYGTPPARKEDVESLATVEIQEASLQCSVCLDDFEVGVEAKQMPCKHSFHADCLLPWLELHSSCPVCRYQLPTADETKTTAEDSAAATQETSDNNGVNESSAATGSSSSSSSSQGAENSDANRHEGEEVNDDGNRNAFSIPWPFSSLFSSSSSQDRNSSD